MIEITLQRPWLIARLPRAMRILSHAPFGGGYVQGDTVLWREVRNADLPQDFAVEAWFDAEMRGAPSRAPVTAQLGLLTSCDIGAWVRATAQVGEITAQALVTLGLSNAEAVGQRLPWHSAEYGTVNILVATHAALTEGAQLEALTIAVEARTAAIIALNLDLATGRATGTGTDCLALACDPGSGRYAGLHTDVGEAIGAAVGQAVAEAGRNWCGWREAKQAARV